MGWAYYEINGKPCGYSVAATCEEPGCTTKIDRGLAYICGNMPDSGEGCGRYFCYEHLFMDVDEELAGAQRCAKCHAARAS